jgi:hypothetical protein
VSASHAQLDYTRVLQEVWTPLWSDHHVAPPPPLDPAAIAHNITTHSDSIHTDFVTSLLLLPPAAIAHNITQPIAVTDVVFHKGTGAPKLNQLLQWAVWGSGPLTTPGCDHGAFVKSRPDLEEPDLQVGLGSTKGV